MKDSKMPSFLFQQNYFRFEAAEILGMASGVASGMKYLARIGYIHRVIKTLSIDFSSRSQSNTRERYMSDSQYLKLRVISVYFFWFRIWRHVTFCLMINKYAKFQILLWVVNWKLMRHMTHRWGIYLRGWLTVWGKNICCATKVSQKNLAGHLTWWADINLLVKKQSFCLEVLNILVWFHIYSLR